LAAGDGLLLFTTVEQAQAALADVLARYEHHSAAARALAEDHLDSDKVLTTLANSVLRSA
jgi:phosphoribosylamine-glycine ligase